MNRYFFLFNYKRNILVYYQITWPNVLLQFAKKFACYREKCTDFLQCQDMLRKIKINKTPLGLIN